MKKARTFTLIELIAVIVILAIVAVVAIPRYVNMEKSAANAVANAIFAAAQTTCFLNHAKGQTTNPTHTAISDVSQIVTLMASNDKWKAVDSKNLQYKQGNLTYTIKLDASETSEQPAVLSLLTP